MIPPLPIPPPGNGCIRVLHFLQWELVSMNDHKGHRSYVARGTYERFWSLYHPFMNSTRKKGRRSCGNPRYNERFFPAIASRRKEIRKSPKEETSIGVLACAKYRLQILVCIYVGNNSREEDCNCANLGSSLFSCREKLSQTDISKFEEHLTLPNLKPSNVQHGYGVLSLRNFSSIFSNWC